MILSGRPLLRTEKPVIHPTRGRRGAVRLSLKEPAHYQRVNVKGTVNLHAGRMVEPRGFEPLTS